jgi:predicted metal-dependent hydrolase
MAGRGKVDRFMRGVRLFNRGRFFEAHEVWEELWKPSTGETRQLYQGLIQAAASLHHAARGNRAGALAVWAKAKVRLELCPERYRGVSIAGLCAELADYFGTEGRGAPPRLKRAPTK